MVVVDDVVYAVVVSDVIVFNVPVVLLLFASLFWLLGLPWFFVLLSVFSVFLLSSLLVLSVNFLALAVIMSWALSSWISSSSMLLFVLLSHPFW